MHEERAVAIAFDKPVVIVDSGAYRPSTALDFHPRVRPLRSLSVSEAIVRVAALRDGTPQPPLSALVLPAPVSAPAVDGADEFEADEFEPE